MFCLFDLRGQISQLTTLAANSISVIGFQWSHGPAGPFWMSSTNGFQCSGERIRGLLSVDINTDIFAILMSGELPWFYGTTFKSSLSLWHKQEHLLSLNPCHIQRCPGSSIIHAGWRRTDWIVTNRAVIDGEDAGGMSFPLTGVKKRRIRDIRSSWGQVHSRTVWLIFN